LQVVCGSHGSRLEVACKYILFDDSDMARDFYDVLEYLGVFILTPLAGVYFSCLIISVRLANIFERLFKMIFKTGFD
jgi:hypothetical protein